MITILQHVPYESPGWILDWFRDHGMEYRLVNLYRGDPLPEPDHAEGVVVMGGPMNVHEEQLYPWLSQEKQFIGSCIDMGKKVLGICLGAQLIAASLGARVRRNPALEIGWFPIDIEQGEVPDYLKGIFPDRFITFHWHGDAFEVPAGGMAFASSEACRSQGFAIGGHVLALQFHPEIKEDGVEALLVHDRGDLLSESAFVQTAAEIRSGKEHIALNRRLLDRLMNALYHSQ